MKSSMPRPATLREIELEVEAEGREWTRQRLQEEADRHGEVFPPQRPAPGASAATADATAHQRRGH